MRLDTMPSRNVQPTLCNALLAMWLQCRQVWGEYRAESRMRAEALRSTRWAFDTRPENLFGRLLLAWEHLWCRPWLTVAMWIAVFVLCWATVDLLCYGPISLYVIARFGQA